MRLVKSVRNEFHITLEKLEDIKVFIIKSDAEGLTL